ncbi:MAG TPA: ABC transporter permease subunit [Ktedonobacteraceae bacterium]|nr:ABC transporter permease subunit [Ktedonobacteraceae bacterium]
MRLLLITRFTLLEAIRRRLFLAVIILSVLIVTAFTILLTIVVNDALASPNNGTDSHLMLLGGGVIITVLVMWMLYLLSSMLTIVFSANMISGEVEAGTFAVIVPKPLRRFEIVLGKWLGYALIVCIYTALMFLAFLGVIYWKTGYWPTGAPYALGTLELAMLALLGITTLGSSTVPTIVNGAIALMLFIGAPTANIVQFIVQFVNPSSLDTTQNIATVINLIIPTDALWHGASFYLLPSVADLVALRIGSFNTPFTSGQPMAPALLVWAALYCIALPALAALRFQHRDL